MGARGSLRGRQHHIDQATQVLHGIEELGDEARKAERDEQGQGGAGAQRLSRVSTPASGSPRSQLYHWHKTRVGRSAHWAFGARQTLAESCTHSHRGDLPFVYNPATQFIAGALRGRVSLSAR